MSCALRLPLPAKLALPATAPRPAAALAFGLALAALVAGCAAPGPKSMQLHLTDSAEERKIFFPPLPDVPRYLYAGQLLGEVNFQAPKKDGNTIGSFFRWLVGLGEQQPIELQRPQSGTVDEAGRIYVTDAGLGAVYVFDPVAGELAVWTGAGGLRNFSAPVGIALGAQGEILVADAQLGLVARLDRNGEPRGTIGKGVLKRPTGLAYDPKGRRLYVADTYAHDIKIFDDQGTLLKTAGRRGEAPGEFNFPTHLAFANGELYVTDTMNSRIQVLDAAGETVKLRFGERGLYLGNLVRPKGVAVDAEGNIYVVESYHDYLLVYNRGGQLLLALGGTGGGIGQFYLPSGVWVDRGNRVFVSDMFNARVMVFQFLGGSGDGK